MLSQFVNLLVCPKCSINIFNAFDEKCVEHVSLLVFVIVFVTRDLPYHHFNVLFHCSVFKPGICQFQPS